MTTSASTVAWIGAGGVIVGAVVGALSSWITAVVTSRRAAREARDDRQRMAYSSFLYALDQMLALLFTASDFTQEINQNPAVAEGIRQASSSIAETSVSVLLVGSPRAQAAIKGIEDARWGVLAGLINPERRGDLPSFFQQFANVKAEIADIVSEELAGRQSSWTSWRSGRPHQEVVASPDSTTPLSADPKEAS